MLDKIKCLLSRFKVPAYVYIVAVSLGILILISSCQGLFNLNSKDSKVDVVVTDAFKIKGGDGE